MHERAHLVHGTFAVESLPGKGTTILVAVPIPPEQGHLPEATDDYAT
jgi:nitrate/nitrite-specific signal transduction histidine kinase